VKNRSSLTATPAARPSGFPEAGALAALRAWHEGLSAREAVARYLGDKKADGQSSRSILGRIRRDLATFARMRHRNDLAELFEQPAGQRLRHARAVSLAIEQLRSLPEPVPLIGDDIAQWLPPRVVQALRSHGIKTLAELTLRIPRGRRWWASIAGLGQAGARSIEAFFAQHPELTERARALTERARALIVRDAPQDLVPWERLQLPQEFDGSKGSFRAPRGSCILNADNDYDAVRAWLSLHESEATQRAYRKEAERLILWAIGERARPLSSLTTEDAIGYRAFLRHPAPRSRLVGPPRPRTSSEWRPFASALSSRSVAYALSVLGALFRWLIEQRYLLANPFAGIKVRGAARSAPLDASRAFSDGEWALIRAVAEGLEWSYGWSIAAAQRLRFLLDFGYATGLRASELVGVTLGQIKTDTHDDHWLHLVGKGSKAGKVALPPLARAALDLYLVQRALPTTPSRWEPGVPLLASLEEDAGISGARLWSITRRFFATAAKVIDADAPGTAEKLRRASPHWMRHTHASHALAHGAELTTVRDNLRHASISTTSIYVHGDEVKRARQLGEAFAAPAR
jgi:site-specific recombinase XerD